MNQDEYPPTSNSSAGSRKERDNLVDSLKELFRPNPNKSHKLIRVILNPASGQTEPELKIFNRTFKEAGYAWDVRITQQAGDGTRLAKEAIGDGADIIAVYGGDGSVMEVAAGMVGSNIPLGIIPGGTGNVISIELGIPRDTAAACALIASKSQTLRNVDLGTAGEVSFMLRTGIGLEATVTKSADRDAKDKYGIFAYVISAVQALAEPDMVHYHLTIDGKEIHSEGLSCVVANSGSLGVAGLALSSGVNVSDGLLDIFIIRKADLVSLFSLAASVIGGNENSETMPHWTGKEIDIVADPVQEVQADGELIGESPVHIKVLPQALKVIVPSEVSSATGSTTARPDRKSSGSA
jgi:diacylglycerol kinase (ATP)